MKKIVFGFICGVGAVLATGALASSVIQTTLFPSVVTFHTHEGATALNEGDSAPVLMYNQRTYVPLRTFAETIGATVLYGAPTEEGSLPRIDVYSQPLNFSENDLIYSDEAGYVSLGLINLSSEDQFHQGIVKVNQDLTNKVVRLHALTASGGELSTAEIYIHQQDSNPPQAGDIRTFDVSMDLSRITSFNVSVEELLYPMYTPEMYEQHGKPIFFSFAPPSGSNFLPTPDFLEPPEDFYIGPHPFAGTVQRRSVIPFSFTMVNQSKENLVVDPVMVELTISRLHEDQTETIVYQKKLPPISGLWERDWAYRVRIPWNVTDNEGKPLEYGLYRISLMPQETITYTIEGSTEAQSFLTSVRFNHFFVTIE